MLENVLVTSNPKLRRTLCIDIDIREVEETKGIKDDINDLIKHCCGHSMHRVSKLTPTILHNSSNVWLSNVGLRTQAAVTTTPLRISNTKYLIDELGHFSAIRYVFLSPLLEWTG